MRFVQKKQENVSHRTGSKSEARNPKFETISKPIFNTFQNPIPYWGILSKFGGQRIPIPAKKQVFPTQKPLYLPRSQRVLWKKAVKTAFWVTFSNKILRGVENRLSVLNPKHQDLFVSDIWAFGFLICFGFRYSNFESFNSPKLVWFWLCQVRHYRK